MDEAVGARTRNALSAVATRLRAARRDALAEAAVPESERKWEYAGRTWSWPAGEAMTHFRALAPDERAVLDRAADDHGIEVLGVGTGRVAVALPDEIGDEPLVAKLARYGPSAEMGAGKPQNRRERRVWDAIGEHPFLPVRDGDEAGNWLVMPEVDVVADDSETSTATANGTDVSIDDALDQVRAALTHHLDRFHLDELKPENVGAYDGRYWIIDYGRPAGESLFVEPPETE
ncbi:hypothetical protein [Halorubrum sp. DTA98]|uniref:hypothetical protein n=1 Tax=Halorubrum sp. DTA98 TaxID=3402163 RepID=UPI003AAE14A7